MICYGGFDMKEFKILEFKNCKNTYEEIESVLSEKTSDGWDVVSFSTDMSKDIKGRIIVLIQRNK